MRLSEQAIDYVGLANEHNKQAKLMAHAIKGVRNGPLSSLWLLWPVEEAQHGS
jgi:hypothetical protein